MILFGGVVRKLYQLLFVRLLWFCMQVLDVIYAHFFFLPAMILFGGDGRKLCQLLLFACYNSVWRW